MAVATPHRELPLLQQALQEAFPWKLNQLTLLKMEHEKAIWLTAFDTPTTFDQTPDGHVQFRRAILRFLQSQAEWQPEVWADPRCYSWFHRDSPHTQRLLKLAGLLDPLASLNPQIQHTAVSQETTR
jgi:hypothetical protein